MKKTKQCVSTYPTRAHISQHNIKWLRIKTIEQPRYEFKCDGFWYGWKDSWLKHLRIYSPNYTPKHIYKIHISKSFMTSLRHPNPHKILLLNTKQDVCAFADRYAKKRNTKQLAAHFLENIHNQNANDDEEEDGFSAVSMSEQEYQRYYKHTTRYKYDYSLIYWRSVAKDFGGIEIQNWKSLCPSLRNSVEWDPRLDWLNDWDLSSGCVWNTHVLKHIQSHLQKIKYCTQKKH